ncbi:MAG: hypothetical protein ACYCT0_11700, partial [Sulfobacillus sp.]
GVPEVTHLDTFVVPNYKRTGISAALVGAAEAECKARGLEYIAGTVRGQVNEVSRILEGLGKVGWWTEKVMLTRTPMPVKES